MYGGISRSICLICDSIVWGVASPSEEIARRALALAATWVVEAVADIYVLVNDGCTEEDDEPRELTVADDVAVNSKTRGCIGAIRMIGLQRPLRGTYCGVFRGHFSAS